MFLTTNDLAKAIDNKAQVDMAILDFSKAFDTVAHTRLKHYWTFTESEAIYSDGLNYSLPTAHSK